jgi:hypothetical protein
MISSASSAESGAVAAISRSVNKSLAAWSLESGSLTSPSLGSSRTMSSPSTPLSSPRNSRRPSSFSLRLIRASWPCQSSKSRRRVSGLSMPGADLETVAVLDRVGLVEPLGEPPRQPLAILERQLAGIGPLGHHLEGRIVLPADHHDAHELEALGLDLGLDQFGQSGGVRHPSGIPSS